MNYEITEEDSVVTLKQDGEIKAILLCANAEQEWEAHFIRAIRQMLNRIAALETELSDLIRVDNETISGLFARIAALESQHKALERERDELRRLNREAQEQRDQALADAAFAEKERDALKLRSAAAESRLREIEAQEPVAWLSIDCIDERFLCFTKPNDNDEAHPLYAAPAAPKVVLPEYAQPQVEPMYVAGYNACLAEVQRLNPQPAPREPTEEECERILANYGTAEPATPAMQGRAMWQAVSEVMK